ncbi:acyltransferase [bacterium]|nr:acyltransferase [bacterium]
MSTSKIGYAQTHPVFGNREANLEKVKSIVTSNTDADLLVFPELGTSGYEYATRSEIARVAEPLKDGVTSRLLLELAKTHDTILIIGYPELHEDEIYNSAMLVEPDGTIHNYRKLHLFSREQNLFDPGDAEPPVIETRIGCIGMMICFDWVFPETARLLGLKGAQLIAHPSNLVLQYCQKAMYARSVENRVFSITCNRIGTEKSSDRSLTFTGASQILSPKGEVLCNAPSDEEHVAIVEVNLTDADNKWITPENSIFEDRRIDHYGRLLKELDVKNNL